MVPAFVAAPTTQVGGNFGASGVAAIAFHWGIRALAKGLAGRCSKMMGASLRAAPSTTDDLGFNAFDQFECVGRHTGLD
jgi:hypothetical protein